MKAILKSVIILIVSFPLGCTSKQSNSVSTTAVQVIPDSVYIENGNRLIALTFDTLRNSLVNAIGSKGIEEAITFCNEQAYPLTATYSGDSVSIRRTSTHFRNPDNEPDSLELLVLSEMAEEIKSSSPPKVQLVRKSSGEVHFFKPIMLQAMCLNCHGAPNKEIQPATLARIQQLYPADQAVNFKEGDLRGMWHVIFSQ
jgi:hypothetical protein